MSVSIAHSDSKKRAGKVARRAARLWCRQLCTGGDLTIGELFEYVNAQEAKMISKNATSSTDHRPPRNSIPCGNGREPLEDQHKA